ncbi:uncharacterized protein LOC134421048 [Melospiza melodia melodia]|uniref:uncharacterized protein LOC134421048 n=1 Tax=Melospiza melodia melodia TaxID=1914991 RepID=UPI002FD6908F
MEHSGAAAPEQPQDGQELQKQEMTCSRTPVPENCSAELRHVLLACPAAVLGPPYCSFLQGTAAALAALQLSQGICPALVALNPDKTWQRDLPPHPRRWRIALVVPPSSDVLTWSSCSCCRRVSERAGPQGWPAASSTLPHPIPSLRTCPWTGQKRGWGILGLSLPGETAGLGCALWPLLQLLSSGIPCSLPDAAKDPAQGLDPARSCWRSVGQKFTNLAWCREMISMFTKGAAEAGPTAPQSIPPAPSLDQFGERVVSSPSQVPGFVRNLHQRLASNEPPDDWLFMDILRLTEEQPTDVAVTLLRCAPTCDRYRAHLPWGLRPSPVQPVQWALLDRQRVPGATGASISQRWLVSP